MVQGQLPPRKIVPWIIAPWMIAPQIIAPEDNFPLENCPLTIKFPSKIIAPTQAYLPKRVLRVNWGKLCIVYDCYNIWVLQLRSKKWFTSMHVLQILTKPCWTPLNTTKRTKWLLIFLRRNAKNKQNLHSK